MRTTVLLGAVLLDALLGEPRRLHPVRGMGRTIDAFRRSHVGRKRVQLRLRGLAFVTAGAAASAAGALLVQRLLQRRHGLVSVLGASALLKPGFALRELLGATGRVQHALERGDLAGARFEAGHHLVSRPTAELEEHEVASAAIESVAENLTDSVVAPLVYYALGGIPAAYAYRFINTADAMIGYRTPELAKLGWGAARLDDLVNYVPARFAAGCIALCAGAGAGCTRASVRQMLRDAQETASPNAGWTMAAMAGALGVRLSKRGHYTLNGGERVPVARDIARANAISAAAAALAITMIALAVTRIQRCAP